MKFNDLTAQWDAIKHAAMPQIEQVLSEGSYILGKDAQAFEEEFAYWNDNRFAVGVGSGTDALTIALTSLELEGKTLVIIPANTYVATVFAASHALNGPYTVKLVDCDEYYQIDCIQLARCLEDNRRLYRNAVVMPVHLYGHSCDMETILKLQKHFDFKIVEDCSQAHGTKGYDHHKVGTYGDIAAFSLYPGKNLGAMGDAGIIVMNDDCLYNRCRILRNLGSSSKYFHNKIGWNSRLDTIQAVILRAKLWNLNKWNSRKQEVAQRYLDSLDSRIVTLPRNAPYCTYNSYHVFPVLACCDRDRLANHLYRNDVPTLIHYPIPIEKLGAFKHLFPHNPNTCDNALRLLSLPIHPFMTEHEVSHVVSSVKSFS